MIFVVKILDSVYRGIGRFNFWYF